MGSGASRPVVQERLWPLCTEIPRESQCRAGTQGGSPKMEPGSASQKKVRGQAGTSSPAEGKPWNVLPAKGNWQGEVGTDGIRAAQACEGPEDCWLGPRGGARHPDGVSVRSLLGPTTRRSHCSLTAHASVCSTSSHRITLHVQTLPGCSGLFIFPCEFWNQIM